MHPTREVATLARCLHRARAPERIARARRWLLDYADSRAGQSRVVLALVDLATGESLALTSGSRDGVWIGGAPARWLARPGRRVWTVHNHPEGRSASPVAVLPSIADLSMLGRSAIETVEVCTARGLVSATTVGCGWLRPDAHGALASGARWARAVEAARRIRDGLAATASVSWSQAHRTAHAATLEALVRAGLIRIGCSEDLEPLWGCASRRFAAPDDATVPCPPARRGLTVRQSDASRLISAGYAPNAAGGIRRRLLSG